MTWFRVYAHDDGTVYREGHYTIEANGVLTIEMGGGRRRRYSPSGWQCVEEEAPGTAHAGQDIGGG